MIFGEGKKACYDEARCLFCLTGQEKEVARSLNGVDGVRALIPMRVKRYKEKGEWREDQKVLFPGYVFVYSSVGWLRSSFERVPGVLKVLTYREDRSDLLKGPDADFAGEIWSLEGKIGVMRAAQVGQQVLITDGVFKALRGRVVAMDRRKMTAKIELSIVGSLLSCWLSYEVIDTLGPDDKIEVDSLKKPE